MKTTNEPVNGIKFIELAPDQTDFDDWAQKYAQCYRSVYGEDSAWQEGKICHHCSKPGNQKKWRLSQAPMVCPHCKAKLDDFWPMTTVLGDLHAILRRQDAICIIACSDKQVIGGCLGFSATPQELERHLNEGVDETVKAQKVTEGIMNLCPTINRVAYQDEIFVMPEWQGLRVGRRLFFERHSFFLSRGLMATTLRTKTNPPSMSHKWFHDRWNFQIIARYPDFDRRVILGQTCNKIQTK